MVRILITIYNVTLSDRTEISVADCNVAEADAECFKVSYIFGNNTIKFA